jgi:catechol 2,3-dioxygenase-like lactoylglutathione lyase family enzyme
MTTTPVPQFRVARPSRDLDAAERFYTGSLGLTVVARFEDHDGFDGVMLGHSAWPYHLELTRRRNAPVNPQSTEEDLLVFYLPDVATWNAIVARLRTAGAREVPAANPYWRVHGVTFTHPDGYRIVLQNETWGVGRSA